MLSLRLLAVSAHEPGRTDIVETCRRPGAKSWQHSSLSSTNPSEGSVRMFAECVLSDR